MTGARTEIGTGTWTGNKVEIWTLSSENWLRVSRFVLAHVQTVAKLYLCNVMKHHCVKKLASEQGAESREQGDSWMVRLNLSLKNGNMDT